MSADNISNNSTSRQKKWGGSGSTSVARRSRAAATMADDENHTIDFGGPNNDHFMQDSNDDDDGINLFESIGRELDKCEEDVKASKRVDEDHDQVENDKNDIIHDEELEVPTEAFHPLSISNADDNVEHESTNAGRKSAESVRNATSGDDNLNIQNANVINNNSASQNINDNEHSKSTKRRPRGSSIMKTKLSPPRFSFQSQSSSSLSSVKPKSIKSSSNNNKSSTYKTPSNNKSSSLTSRELFSSRSTMPQHKSTTIIKSTQKLSGSNNSIMLSTTQKRKRHSFRPSSTNSNATSAVNNNNNVREMGFVPTFLSNAKSSGGGGSGANTSPKDVPADDDDDNVYDSTNNNRDAYSKNMITNFQQQQRQARKSESSSSNTKSGYLVQRLRSLRNTDQRMVMRLRSGQYSSSSSSSAAAAAAGFTARKRRRSGGDHLDPKNAASSILDVTVSSSITSSFEKSNSRINASLLGEGKSVLPAYIHCYKAMKQQLSSGHSSEHCEKEMGMLTNFPCYAWIVMSHDVMREQNIIMEGENGTTTTTTKQLRLYDAVVIPQRVVNTKNEQRSVLDEHDMNQNHDASISSIQMPTIICTHICHEYPAEEKLPPLQDVSFDQFN